MHESWIKEEGFPRTYPPKTERRHFLHFSHRCVDLEFFGILFTDRHACNMASGATEVVAESKDMLFSSVLGREATKIATYITALFSFPFSESAVNNVDQGVRQQQRPGTCWGPGGVLSMCSNCRLEVCNNALH